MIYVLCDKYIVKRLVLLSIERGITIQTSLSLKREENENLKLNIVTFPLPAIVSISVPSPPKLKADRVSFRLWAESAPTVRGRLITLTGLTKAHAHIHCSSPRPRPDSMICCDSDDVFISPHFPTFKSTWALRCTNISDLSCHVRRVTGIITIMSLVWISVESVVCTTII